MRREPILPGEAHRGQTAILAHYQGEWIFINETVDEEPERIYPGYDSAMEELGREGWGVIDGPMMLRSVAPGFEAINLLNSWGYRLRRMFQ
jgi:hypothetical protein